MLQSLNLPGSIEAVEAPVGLPPSLLNKAAELRAENGPNRIRALMQDVLRVARTDRKILDEVRSFLLTLQGKALIELMTGCNHTGYRRS